MGMSPMILAIVLVFGILIPVGSCAMIFFADHREKKRRKKSILYQTIQIRHAAAAAAAAVISPLSRSNQTSYTTRPAHTDSDDLESSGIMGSTFVSDRNGSSLFLGRNRDDTNTTGPERPGLPVRNMLTDTVNNSNLNRNQSIRSVITLPAYSFDPIESEKVIAREGERGGVDVVVEPPETSEEVEERREIEMESLFQIRQARRAEREARRRHRQQERDALARGDQDAVRALRAARRIALTDTGSQSSTSLISAHQQLTQMLKPRVSSVYYGSIGVARLDGSRVRSSSPNSDQNSLLDPNGSAISVPSLAAFPDGQRHTRSASVASLGSSRGLLTRSPLPPLPPFELHSEMQQEDYSGVNLRRTSTSFGLVMQDPPPGNVLAPPAYDDLSPRIERALSVLDRNADSIRGRTAERSQIHSTGRGQELRLELGQENREASVLSEDRPRSPSEPATVSVSEKKGDDKGKEKESNESKDDTAEAKENREDDDENESSLMNGPNVAVPEVAVTAAMSPLASTQPLTDLSSNQ